MVDPVPQLEALPVKRGTRVLLRNDFNVPLRDGHIEDDLRITAALPTIEWLRHHGAGIVCCSHLGRPKGKPDPQYSLAPVAARLGDLLHTSVELAPDVAGFHSLKMAHDLLPHEVIMIENLRFHPGEEECDPAFATDLSDLGDVYVNDAFGAAHRSHASIIGPPLVLPSAAGRLLALEVDALGRLLRDDVGRPFVAVLGGAKVSDKLGVIDALLAQCDQLLIGGAMAFTFLAAQGYGVGVSLVEHDRVDHCASLLASGRISLPADVVVAREMGADAETRHVAASEIPDGWIGLDIGPESAGPYADAIVAARTVLWNGPMGVFELEPFAAGTRAIAAAMAECRGYTVVGGGDSAAAVRKLGYESAIDHVSTGGGASLELLERGDLPGLVALRKGPRRS
ncbi:MAG: phosphoglycerate kinase [Actinomycetota bacterium]